jgi:fibro-slime domain-containing protein
MRNIVLVAVIVLACVACAGDDAGSASQNGAVVSLDAGSDSDAQGSGNGNDWSFGNTDASAPTLQPRDAAGLDEDAGGGDDPDEMRDENCGKIQAIVRDFSPSTHPDFEVSLEIAKLTPEGQRDIVKAKLETGYPAFAATTGSGTFAGPAEFYQWYVDTPGINEAFTVDLPLTEDAPGHFVYDNDAFFPIDDQGFGNEGNAHNYHFTTEVRTKFTYQGGEQFTFRGDDDLWMFVDGVLAIDLGGLHQALEATVDMDTFAKAHGLVKGKTYSMDIFHAERHTTESNFRIETTIDCFIPVQPPPPPPPPVLD